MSDDFDPFRELQLSPEAEPELVKAAFKALAKKYHPDRFQDPQEKAQAEERMKRINEAQQLLASGQYRPPAPSLPAEEEAPPRVVPPPPPVRRTPGVRRIGMGPALAAAAVVFFALMMTNVFSADHINKALEFEKSGQIEQALAELNQAISKNPKAGVAYFHRARLWQTLGQPERAKVDTNNAHGLLSERQLQDLQSRHPEPQSEPTPTPSPAEGPDSQPTNSGADGLP